MLAASLLFLLSLLGLLGAVNALRGPALHRRPALRPPFLPVLLTAEAVPLRVLIHGVVAALLIWAGALQHLAGRAGLVITLFTWVAYVFIQWRAAGTKRVFAHALGESGIDVTGFARIEWRRVLAAYPFRIPKGIERVDDIEYAPGLHLDLYRAVNGTGARPVLLYLHGGSWRGGNRRQQGRPLIHRVVESGWIAVSASYPLIPGATFPDQLIALKRAVQWLREEGPDHGIDPSFIAVSGGSAGAHLASLIALTANRPEYQPGFEHVNTEVQAAIPVYGIYDFLNRNSTRDDWPFIARWVMKADPVADEDLFRAASPLDQVHRGAPPFLIIHGESDSVVPTAEAEQFVTALEDVSEQRVIYAEVPGANHAFDVLDSLRTHYVISGVQRFLDSVRVDQSAGRRSEPEAT